ncbi:RNA polymerase sigma-70 factor (ECF subfamily) [Saccharopolyspora erythraea NRRL 2338]|uniref:RNA polymerase sigma factor n=2 Tax=Saccharopolyspora erythraea TaxID=1836 RepID=A4FPY8_SACEN|nr:RNA polymerase sigma 70 [Saccharopolyspora erythraea D]PFG99758.1 RNA polymerase sigma-70 factor (ECF subfamily) [Saccharopolyspora erythraea NRRL 2338]QRK89636.1 sigma-70 family RNA polymerase sigma factor [Saccharopolyspora erythraea]CAM06113.1 putative RNA polymerase sigma factor [Saccharopolyspora erythraea NRRL 2338]
MSSTDTLEPPVTQIAARHATRVRPARTAPETPSPEFAETADRVTAPGTIAAPATTARTPVPSAVEPRPAVGTATLPRTGAPAPATPAEANAPAPEATPGTSPAAEPEGPGENWAYVDAAQKGDSDAFGKLYDEYSQVVYRYVLFRVGDHCLAEDITSETFLRALRRIASVSYQGRDVAAWFITIAKNLIFDHIKSSRNRLEVPTADLAETPSQRRTHQVGPEHHVLSEVTNRELLHSVCRLNTDQRECIRLRFFQGLSVTETAARMNRNEGAIKALQHRAIRRLAQLLPDDVR